MRNARITLLLLSVVALLGAGFQAGVAAAPACTIEGSPGGEVIIGTIGRDVICAQGGNDWIDPRGGTTSCSRAWGMTSFAGRLGRT